MATLAAAAQQRHETSRLLAALEMTTTWRLEPTSSSLTFQARHSLGLPILHGRFDDLRGEAVIEPNHRVRAEVTIGSDSIKTRWALQDRRLRSPAFQDAALHTEIAVSVVSGVLHESGILALAGDVVVRDHAQRLRGCARLRERDLACEHVTIDAELTLERRPMAMRGRGLLRGECILARARFCFAREPAIEREHPVASTSRVPAA